MKEKIIKILEKETNLSNKEVSTLLEIPPNSSLGDFAFPCFGLSKKLKKSPNEISKELAQKIKSKYLEKVESKGPYLNLFLNRKELAKSVLEKESKKPKKESKKIVIEFPSPNTNKPLHLGHVRNIVLGQSVSEILTFTGNNVIKSNLNNDRGVHICKSMVAYELWGKNSTPEKEKIKSDHFVGKMYVEFAKHLKEDPSLDKTAQDYLLKWEKKDKDIRGLWKKMNSWALEGFEETYKRFGLKFDNVEFESKIYNDGKEIVLNSFKKGITKKKEDGAIFIDLEKEGLGEKILLRGDGTSIYITQDLNLAVKRKEKLGFDSLFYVSAVEQIYHFKALFTILKKLGYKWADNLQHLSYGMVNLESGRMKSREGNVVDADKLLDELEALSREELKKRNKDLSEKDLKEKSKKISLSALRYYFLKVEKGRDMVFKPEESISFDGNTGPYLLYTYARARSIIKKSKNKGLPKYDKITDLEKELLFELAKFNEVILQARNTISPNLIANYCFELAKKFNEYYQKEKIIGSNEEEFKVQLIEKISKTIKGSLSLLKIDVLEEM